MGCGSRRVPCISQRVLQGIALVVRGLMFVLSQNHKMSFFLIAVVRYVYGCYYQCMLTGNRNSFKQQQELLRKHKIHKTTTAYVYELKQAEACIWHKYPQIAVDVCCMYRNFNLLSMCCDRRYSNCYIIADGR